METDILVVGAGPAGLSAAERACRLGASVHIIEKSTEIGFPVHSSGGSWVKDMKEHGVPEKYYNPIKNAIFSSPSKEAELSLKSTEACILRIRPFYQYLATKAAAEGATFSLGTNVKHVVMENKNHVIMEAKKSGENIKITAKVVIDSSGFSAVVARSAGLLNKWKRFGYGAEYEAWVESIDQSSTVFMVGRDAAPSGYAWIFPLSQNRARIGVGVIKPDSQMNPLNLLNKLLQKRIHHIESLGRVVPLELHIGFTPADGPVSLSARGRILLAGDAAGQVSPHVGEGIRFAIHYGEMVGQTAYSMIHENDLEKGEEYDKKWKRDLESKFKLALRFQKRLVTLSDDSWDRGVEILRSLSSKEFARLLRWDITGRFLFNLAVRHPRISTSSTIRMLLKFAARRKGG